MGHRALDPRRIPGGGSRAAWVTGPILLPVVTLLLACAPGPEIRPLPTPPTELDAELRRDGGADEPTRLIFGWRLNEQGSRVEGRGVARVGPGYRARLDLFTENGETAARAALVDGDLRIPPEVDRRLVPPPPLLWASLGIFHPPYGSELLGGEAVGETGARLRYGLPGERQAHFHLEGALLTRVELLQGGSVTQRVELEWSSEDSDAVREYPARATYRDLTAFRELTVTLESMERTDGFDSEIWQLDD